MFKKTTLTVLAAFGGLLSMYILFHTQKSKGAVMQKITLTSTAFKQGQPIPRKHSGEGEDFSPQLAWGNVPTEAQSIVVISDDPDAPGGTWVHWVVYDLPASTKDLAENATITQLGGMLGKNSFEEDSKQNTYAGPLPPQGHGPHRYFFKIYALNKKLTLLAGATKEEVEAAMKGHIIGYGELMGTYERK